jgi:hypothetical protein
MARARLDGRSSPDPADQTSTGGSDDVVRRAVDRIGALAAAGQTGALNVVGQPGGLVFFVDGHIGHAESPATPGVEATVLRSAMGADDTAWADVVAAMQTRTGRDAAAARAEDLLRRGHVDPVQLAVIVQLAIADALLAMLAGPGAAVTRTRFLGGQRPWIELADPIDAAQALGETARRGRLLADVARRVRPDDAVARRHPASPGRVRLTAPQWDVLRLTDGRRTSRDLAWLLGRGVLATTVHTHQLVELGAVQVGDTPTAHDGARHRPGAPHRSRHTVSYLAAATAGRVTARANGRRP